MALLPGIVDSGILPLAKNLNSDRDAERSTLPPVALAFLSGAAHKVLEALRHLPGGTTGRTNYGHLMQHSGLRSTASISKALKELQQVGAINYQVARVRGRVDGLRLTWLGIPTKTCGRARAFFREPIIRQMDRLKFLLKEIDAGDGEPSEGEGR